MPERLAAIDAGDLGGEGGTQGMQRYRHGGSFSERVAAIEILSHHSRPG